MELTTLRNSIVKLLHKHTKRPVVMIRQTADKPLTKDKKEVDYPFIGYNFLGTLIKDKEMGVYEDVVIESNNPNFEKDIQENLHLQSQFTISFSVYSKDTMEAKQLALDVWEYFKHIGYYDLQKENIVVIECMNIQNRDIFEVDEYERREGFDVRFRIAHKIQRRLETIEKYTINKI
ncbi:MAG: phage neck terminator protein [Peptoanaerobacter stomatis]|uniref:phage neck terminator protein n=1 Tax=Peptoanaerobacter stomatis TaxID=796937 RepID=UPI003FA047BA